MSNWFKLLGFFFLAFLVLFPLTAFSSVSQIEGFQYVIRKIDNFPLEKEISKNYDLYELYIENRTENTLSIPGYSINFGVNYINIADLSAELKSKLSKKSNVFNIAAGAASLAFGSIAKTAANTAVQSVTSWKKHNVNIGNDEQILNFRRTYVLYPHDQISLYFLVSKEIIEPINSLKLICVNEELNQSYILINNMVDVQKYTVKNKKEAKQKFAKQGFDNLYYDVDDSINDEEIAAPDKSYE